jgi:hypothetical protein
MAKRMVQLATLVPSEDVEKLEAISQRRFGIGKGALLREAIALFFEADVARQKQEAERSAKLRGETVTEAA